MGKLGARDERADQVGTLGHALGNPAEGGHKLVDRVRVPVGELCFEMRPDQFVRVEFGRVARKPFEMQTGTHRACRACTSGPL